MKKCPYILVRIPKKTYKIAAQDMRERRRIEFIEDFECIVVNPPF